MERAHFQDGLLDVGFARDVGPDSSLMCETLYQEPLCLAVSHDHPLASSASVTISTLKEETFLMFPQHLGPSLYAQIMNICEQAGFRPNIVQEFVHMPTCLQLVSSGMGVAFVPLSSCDGARGITSVKLMPEPLINFNMIYAREQVNACQQAFLDLARRIITTPMVREPTSIQP
ncbi:MAG: LysR family substrate-binding domain-containing protein [Deinococcota bacterium]